MNIFKTTKQNNKNISVANGIAQRQNNNRPTSESRLQNNAHDTLQELANKSLQAAKLKTYQELANSSCQNSIQRTVKASHGSVLSPLNKLPIPQKEFSSVLQLMGTSKLKDKKLDGISATFLQKFSNETGKERYEVDQTTFEIQSSNQIETRGNKRINFVYRTNTNYEYTVTINNNDAPALIEVKEIIDNDSLKFTRTDKNDYRWGGLEKAGLLLGFDTKKYIGNTNPPEGYIESHLTKAGKVDGQIKYFKKIDESKSNDEPKFSELIDSEKYRPRIVRGDHKSGSEKKGDANSVMGTSATQYNGHMRRIGGKGSNKVSYEWCHLIGHGDGGKENPENFVAGTHYANTEQLAIETAIRNFRREQLELKVFAFIPQLRPDTPVTNYGADYVSYTIIHNGKIIYGHTINMHSKAFDIMEWNILQSDVQNTLANYFLEKISEASATNLSKSRNKIIQDGQKNSPDRTGRSNKLFEQDVWNELSGLAYEASNKLLHYK